MMVVAFLAMALDHADIMDIIPKGKVLLTIAAAAPLALMGYRMAKHRIQEMKEHKTFGRMVAKQKECDKEYNQKMQTILGSEEIKNVLEKELKWID